MSDFLCNDNAIEHTVCSSHKRGQINRKGFGVKVRIIGTTSSTGWAYSDTLKRAFPPRAEHSLLCCVGGCSHLPPYGTSQWVNLFFPTFFLHCSDV